MEFADKAFVEANQTKERQSSQLVKKFSTLTRMISSGQSEEAILTAYHDVLADCDELTLLTQRVPYVVMANATDVTETQQSIADMKAQAAEIEVELSLLLKELEVRTHVAALNALPTREVLQTTYETEMERELKPIELQKALVAQKVKLHRKHLGVLWAAIQQMEAELNAEHQFDVDELSSAQ